MQFEFRYGLIPVRAQIHEGHLTLSAFARHQQLRLDALRYLYVDHKPGQSFTELLLCEETPRGRLRRARAYANPGEPQLNDLVAALVAARPEIDLRGRPRAEVYALMGSRVMPRAARAVILGGLIAGLLLLFAPLLWHGLDRGRQTLSVAALLQAPPDTHNLTLTGGALLLDEGLVDAGRTADAARAFFPLKASPSGPVVALVEVSGERRLRQIRAGAPLTGVLRDFAWEGPSIKQRRALEARGLTIGPRLYLFEFGARPSTDLALLLLVLSALAIMAWITRLALDPLGRLSKQMTK
ncbi:hypothetical protein KKF91_04240 [Myxococcota bacterium]|nr:hypothetical protein [Myxococcota bacterium]